MRVPGLKIGIENVRREKNEKRLVVVRFRGLSLRPAHSSPCYTKKRHQFGGIRFEVEEKPLPRVKAQRKKGAVLSGIYQNPGWRHQDSVELQEYLSTDFPVLIDGSRNEFLPLENHGDSVDTHQILSEYAGD